MDTNTHSTSTNNAAKVAGSSGMMASQYSPANTEPTPKTPSRGAPPQTEPADPQTAAQQAELATLRRMNATIEGLQRSLDSARANMATVAATVTHATTLLDTWTRILAQTERNQELLLHPAWRGASADAAAAENESADRARREAEDARRREERRIAEREEEERRRAAAEAERAKREAKAAAPTPGRRGYTGTRGRGGITRGGVAASSAAGQSAPSGVERKPTTSRAAAVRQYGRVGSVGTRGARGRGREGGAG